MASSSLEWIGTLTSRRAPEQHALALARAVQERVAPDMVILFGSRATGRHQEDSDLDIMAVTLPDYPPTSGVGASRAGCDYMEDNPPPLEVNVIQMSRQEFDYCRGATQQIAGQTANHETIVNGDRLVEPPPR